MAASAYVKGHARPFPGVTQPNRKGPGNEARFILEQVYHTGANASNQRVHLRRMQQIMQGNTYKTSFQSGRVVCAVKIGDFLLARYRSRFESDSVPVGVE